MSTVPSTTSRLLLSAVAAALGLAVAVAVPRSAAAQPRTVKPAPAVKACGVSAVPLVVGNEWTYEPVAPPPANQLSEAQIKSTPVQPKKLVIKVTGIETKDGVTTVTLHEDLDGKGHDSTITCGGGGARFSVSMNAFWFAGEAGTPIGIELDQLERKGQTLLLTGGKLLAADWHDDVAAGWKHLPTGKATPTMRKGTLTLGRHWVLQPDERVRTAFGEWTSKKLGLETTITLTIDPPPLLPLKTQPLLVNFIWYVDAIGPVQVLNSFGQMYQLTTATLSK